MFGKDLIVVVEFDGKKRIEDIKFDRIPIWLRAIGMPLGMMNLETGKAIGDEVGEFMELEQDDNGSAVGQFLCIKIRLDISKPLMRGVSLVAFEGKEPIWCPIVYEFLPEFCYVCGIIGHTDKMCSMKIQEGEQYQYSKKLRFIPEKNDGRMGVW